MHKEVCAEIPEYQCTEFSQTIFFINVMKAPVMTKMLITWLNVEVSTNILCDKAVWAAKFKLC